MGGSEIKPGASKEGVNASAPCDTASVEGSSPKGFLARAHKLLWTAAMLLCVIAIAVGTYLTYTAYLAGGFLKSVAVNSSSQALFSSDMLEGRTDNVEVDTLSPQPLVVSPNGDDYSFTFTIYNYLPGDSNVVNDKEVNATLAITATGTVTPSGWSVERSVNGGSATTVDPTKESLSFPANKATSYTYTVKFKKADLANNIVFSIKAGVTAPSPGTNLRCLVARVAPCESSSVKAAGVDGKWVNGTSAVGDYAAYNYRVTVTGARTRVTVTWSEEVEIDPFFERNHGVTVDSANRKVTFEMDPGSEEIVFYQASGKDKPDSWGKIVTSCVGEPINGSTGSQG